MSSVKELGFEPTQKELDAFAKEKMDIYKGTFIVCLVYGIVAIALLLLGFFTSWGREYIFDKMLPATTTFVFGALFIIIYLSMSIYDMKPKRIRNKIDKDNGVICPDYWTLKKIDEAEKIKYINNNYNSDGTKILKNIINVKDNVLKYKCEYVGDKNDMFKDNRLQPAIPYTYKGYKTNINITKENNDYFLIGKKDNSSYNNPSQELINYAKFSGKYNGTPDNFNYEAGSNLYLKKENDENITLGTDKPTTIKPLICNMVMPQVLELLDRDTTEKNKYRCEYAKACNVPWTEIGCTL